jgi:mRNA interferase RelE/StbE
MGEFWSYRVGDYRIIALIEDNRLVIVVISVGHRRAIYP